MAAMALKATAEKELDDMNECSICVDVFTDPRILPCFHTFCLKCLLNYRRGRQPGDNMPCPLCGKQFTIPGNGFSGIQKNFFVEKLLQARKLPAGCQTDSQTATCEVHNGEVIIVFCLECKTAVCTLCFMESHNTHDSSNISEVAVDLRKQMLSDTDKASELLKTNAEVRLRFEKEESDLNKRLADTDGEINAEADKMIDAIQRDRAKLLSEVESIRQKRVRQLETVKQDVEDHMTALESLKRYSEMLLSSGTDCDVTRSANNLHDRAKELMKFDAIGHVNNFLPPVTVTFTSSTCLNSDIGNLVGLIAEKDEIPRHRILAVKYIMEGDKRIGAMTSLDNEVFVARQNSQEIEVYDAENFELQHLLAVAELGSQPLGLAVSASNKCLYISDFDNDSIHRVELSGKQAARKWSVARQPVGVTVNDAPNVVVASTGERKLQEFTTHGTLLRDIQLHQDINCPCNVLQLSNEQFLVSHSGPLHRVCLVDDKGAVVRSFGGEPGSDLTKMKFPAGLAVDKDGCILVADEFNDRLLVIDHSLSNANVISVSVDGCLDRPHSLWYDKPRGRLYFDKYDGQVIVIDQLQDFTAS